MATWCLYGRPVGSRTVFSQSFLKDLASVWAERGRAAMEKTAIDQPGVFFATCARLIGPEVKLTIEQTLPGNLSPSDWADLRQLLSAIQTALPDAADRSPGEVFRYALAVLRDCPENTPSSDSSDSHNATLPADLACAAPQK